MKRVLLVDDAATVRMYHRQVLKQKGFQVDEAINGVEALEKAVSCRYDLYLVDVNMPKMDGYSFVRELRSRLDVRQSPVVMVSTESQEKDRLAAFAAGANYYVIKPAKPEELVFLAKVMTGEAEL
jgi:two-component system chemotaxis response regulator CheY|uniref:Response regulator n=1 Tax=Desulfobacca acetoxidans TaxID=60893 RepID=A0A7C3WHM7_9BACT